ncbi:hypothetical protein CFP56_019252 [Quercus suber]|uniref:Uncharacterized protein n=1 Tax=Quercus suber TaxID=58331 RepID=A0AAW0KJ60_QUESU
MSQDHPPLRHRRCSVPLDQRQKLRHTLLHCSPLDLLDSPYQTLRRRRFPERRPILQNDDQPHRQRLSFALDPFPIRHRPPLNPQSHCPLHQAPCRLACHVSQDHPPLRRHHCSKLRHTLLHLSPLDLPDSPYQPLRRHCFFERQPVLQNDDQPHRQRLSFALDPFPIHHRRKRRPKPPTQRRPKPLPSADPTPTQASTQRRPNAAPSLYPALTTPTQAPAQRQPKPLPSADPTPTQAPAQRRPKPLPTPSIHRLWKWNDFQLLGSFALYYCWYGPDATGVKRGITLRPLVITD